MAYFIDVVVVLKYGHMYQEGLGSESGQGFKSLQEIDDRLDVLGEIIDSFGRDSPKGQKALMERAGLLQERSTVEQAEKRKTQPLQEKTNVVPTMKFAERESIQQREDLNAVLAKEMGNLMRFGRPGIDCALTRLRDPNNVQRFLGDQVGIEFFTQDAKGDLQAQRALQTALGRLYQSGTGRSYYEEAA